MPYYYGVQNRANNAKVVVSVAVAGAAPGTNCPAVHSGAHEEYEHATQLVGVGAPLPAGAKLGAWGLNDYAGYSTVQPDGLRRPADTWPG